MNEEDFSASVDRHIFLKSRHITLHIIFTDRLNAIIKGLDLMSSRSLEMGTFGIERNTTSGLNIYVYYVTPVANNISKPNTFGMLLSYDMPSWWRHQMETFSA